MLMRNDSMSIDETYVVPVVKNRSKSTNRYYKKFYHPKTEDGLASIIQVLVDNRIQRQNDTEIVNSINRYLLNSSSESSIVSDIRRYHPLFRKLTFQGSVMIFRQCTLVQLQPSQILYKEGQRELFVYAILYGKLVLRAIEDGVLGVAGPGESVGEEAFLSLTFQSR